ncbi:hypothetical protein E2C01_069181 [Portunus trituberculatus]|uniref:Uncharacterized protein n=1 Tax=Portunus trituberculatus TaxID=210409 RepID=A0A5B7HYK0_PORTR|nr:hypothetical protein [Portunus trituberculatus]
MKAGVVSSCGEEGDEVRVWRGCWMRVGRVLAMERRGAQRGERRGDTEEEERGAGVAWSIGAIRLHTHRGVGNTEHWTVGG